MTQNVLSEGNVSNTSQQPEYDFINFSLGNTWLDPPPHHREPAYCPEAPQFVKLCANGDVDSLKWLLRITRANPPESSIEPTQLPKFDMLKAAVEHKHPVILELLLLTYPQWRIYCPRYLDLAYVNPHYQTFSLLHACAPNIINMDFDRSRSTTLMESCRSGNPLIPEYLIDCGADVNGGTFSNYGPLYTAVTYRQPLSLIRKFIGRGASVNRSAIVAAITRQDIPILRLMLDQGTSSDWRYEMQEAYATKDQEVISLVEERSQKPKAFEKKGLATQLKSERRKLQPRWWQRRL